MKDLERPQLQPEAFRLEAGGIVWPADGYTALLAPLFNGVVDVVLVARGKRSERNIRWNSGQALHLNETGLKVREGRIRFLYSLLNIEP